MGARGCGASREVGGLYCEVNLSPFGRPLEEFLADPPVVVDPQDLGLTPKGVKLIQDGSGTWHVWDWVGSNYYPNVSDFVEEVRRQGVSRRLSSKLEFAKLSTKSRLILLHRRAYIDNFAEYKSAAPCPCNKPGHGSNKAMCVKLWWEDVDEGAEVEEGNRQVVRVMPSFSYEGLHAPVDVSPQYKLAIFASFPISRLVVIRDAETMKHEAVVGKARQSTLNVEVVDE